MADGFYEFADPADPAKKRKDKWLFTRAGQPWFCIAGIWRTAPDVGEAFTMLTTAPGPDIAPYHDRQVAILDRADWAAWLESCGVGEDPAEAAAARKPDGRAGRLTGSPPTSGLRQQRVAGQPSRNTRTATVFVAGGPPVAVPGGSHPPCSTTSSSPT
ncbi:SOS response-associated peptidase family protein [Inquilinus sp. CA228]|uniref:SOS response-associated peptidase family protein n=1 Tax=Inquilinus sp. CA228 TaxID=3455609 RepID=UPI003F8D828D